jgi:phosphoribosylglycinamide formyltransferase 1
MNSESMELPDATAMSQDTQRGSLPFPAVIERPIRLAALISGGGTTLMNFLDQIRTGELWAEVPIVVASQHKCQGIERARRAGLNCLVIRPRDFLSADDFSHAVFARLREVRADLVTMCGFLSLLPIPDDFSGRVINIHPSLIPAFCGHGFYGQHVHEAAIARGVKVSGCSVHFADNHYDHGPIILQRTVAVPNQATAADLAALVFEQEKIAYPDAIRLLAAGRVRIQGQQTIVESIEGPARECVHPEHERSSAGPGISLSADRSAGRL